MAFSSNLGDKANELDILTEKALREVGITGKASCQANCVVGKKTPSPGNLRRSHTFRLNDDKSVTIGITKMAPYGIYVEFKPPARGGRPWFRRTLQAESENFEGIFRKYLGDLK